MHASVKYVCVHACMYVYVVACVHNMFTCEYRHVPLVLKFSIFLVCVCAQQQTGVDFTLSVHGWTLIKICLDCAYAPPRMRVNLALSVHSVLIVPMRHRLCPTLHEGGLGFERAWVQWVNLN